MPAKKETEIVIDVETTGLDYTKERIIEFAAVKLVNGKVEDTFETLINPHQHIRKSSMAVHGITPEMLEGQPEEEDIYPKIFKFIGKHPIVAHNAIFDFSFLNRTSKRLYEKELKNNYIDTQFMFKEVFPQCESCGLDSLMQKMQVETTTRHRAMGDAMGLALAYPELKKMYFEKYKWQLSQIDNIPYLFERYLRIQQAISVMQAEIQDLKSIFKIYFEKGGEEVHASSGEVLTYNSKKTFSYDFPAIKEVLDKTGILTKAVKLNNGFIDRLVKSNSLDETSKEKIKSARIEITENKSCNIIKPDRH